MRPSLAASVAQLQLVNVSKLIPALHGHPKTVRINDVAYDGSAAVGSFANPPDKYDGRRFFIYTKSSGIQEIEALRGQPAVGMRISSNGAVVWGSFYDYRRGTHAGVFRWTREGGVEELGSFGQRGLKIEATSADGQVVVGDFIHSMTTPTYHAFRYSQSRGFEDLGAMGADSAAARGISGDARWVAGHLHFRKGPSHVSHGFVHSETTGLHRIPPHLGRAAFASSISNDGSVVVGTYHAECGFVECTDAPFAYTRQTGIKTILEISAHSIARIIVSPDGAQLSGAYMDSDLESYIFTGTLVIE